MKKLYLLGFLGLCSGAFAQSPAPKAKVPASVANATGIANRVTDRTPQSPVKATPPKGQMRDTYLGKNSRSTRVGTTQNDQQTNASIYRHIETFPGGKISVTWTTSTDQAPYVQRGSGYNHFDGSSWGPVTGLRIESERAGFPSYAYSAGTNEEIITSHRVKTTEEAGGILVNRKTGLGAGTWTTTLALDTTLSLPGVLWNKSVISGDYLHIFASYTDSSSKQPNRVIMNGVRTPQVYSRYQISTGTWIDKNILLPDYDSTRVYSGGGDNYSIDAVGSKVAILLGGLTDDLALWKSDDNGSTWTKTVIDSFPIPAYDYKTAFDTAFSNDGSVHVMMDASGKAHCFWPLARVLDNNTSDNSVTYFPGQASMMYWQEGWSVDSATQIAGAPDIDGNGSFDLASNWNATGARYGNHSVVTMPYAALGTDGSLYMIYSCLTENDVSVDNQNYRDVFAIRSKDGGATWSNPVNLTGWMGINIEQVFASVAKNVEGTLHLTFMQKASIGRYDATDNPNATGPYDIYYLSVDTSIFTSGVSVGLNEAENDLFSIKQNYPNPFHASTMIPVKLNSAAEVTVTVRNIVGQEVYNKNFGTLGSGVNELEIAPTSLNTGVYFYDVKAGGFKSSGKMIVE